MLTIIFSDFFIVIVVPILLIICFLWTYWLKLKDQRKELIKELEEYKNNKTIGN